MSFPFAVQSVAQLQFKLSASIAIQAKFKQNKTSLVEHYCSSIQLFGQAPGLPAPGEAVRWKGAVVLETSAVVDQKVCDLKSPERTEELYNRYV